MAASAVLWARELWKNREWLKRELKKRLRVLEEKYWVWLDGHGAFGEKKVGSIGRRIMERETEELKNVRAGAVVFIATRGAATCRREVTKDAIIADLRAYSGVSGGLDEKQLLLRWMVQRASNTATMANKENCELES